MSERVPAQNKNSATPSQATQSSSPLFEQRPFTDERYESFGSNSNISKELEGIQPKTIRRSLNWQNITVEATTNSDRMSLPGGIQRQQAQPAPAIGHQVSADSEEKSALEVSNSTISTDAEAQQPKIARARLDWRNISIEAPSRSGGEASPQPIQRQQEQQTESKEEKTSQELASTNNSTISTEEQAQQPKIARARFDWRNISVEAPTRSGGDASPQPIQRQQETESKVEKSALELSNSTISTDAEAQKPKIARAGFNWRNIAIEAPSRSAASSTYPGGIQRQETSDDKEGEESSQSLQMQSEGAIQAKCSECQREDEEKQKNQSLQTKLTVGAPGDKYEQEADSMAAKVMTMPDSAIQKPIQRQTEEETEAVQMQPLVNSITPLVQRSSGEEEEVQMKSGVQRASDGSLGASPSVENRLAGSKGGGSALPDNVRNFMEPRFGADFSSVRVHTDSNAVQMNKELGAQAFAHGSDIYFGAGKSPGKDELTAHELTHTIQQTGKVQPKWLNNKQQKQSQPEVQGEMLQAKEIPWMRQEAKQTESVAVEPVNNKLPSDSSAASSAGDAGGMGSDGQGEQPGSQQGAALNAEDPGQIIEQLKNTPPTEAAATYDQAQAASGQALQNQKQQLQSALPEIPAPTGLSPEEAVQDQNADAPQGETPQPDTEQASSGAENAGEELSEEETTEEQPESTEPEGFAPPETPPTSNGNIQDISNINTSAGERPQVDLNGEADPAQMEATEAESHQEVQDNKAQAAEDINQDFGENNIFPEPSDEILKAKHQFAEITPPSEKIGKLPIVPPEAVGGLNQGLTPFYQEKIAPEQEKYQVGKQKFEADSANEKENANKQVESLNEEAKHKQLEEQKKTRQEVTQAKSNWQSELDKVDKDYQDKAGKATKEQQQKIDDEKAKAEAEADQHLTKAEQDAEAEKKKGEEEARRKEEEAKRPKSFLEKVGDFFKDIWEGLKQIFTTIFNAIRDAIKAIFEAVKQVVMAVIDLARQVIVGIIQALGEILKGIVQLALAAFPELAKKFTEQIDNAVNKAVEAVNSVADWLKKAVADVLDFLAKTLDKLLGVLQDLFIGLLSVIGMIITGDIAGLIKGFSNLIEAGKAMPPQFETAGLEELLGGDVNLDKPLSPEELAQAQQAGIDIPGAAGEGNSQTGEAGELPHAPWTEENVGVDAVENNMELSPELAAELMQKTNGDGEVMLAESDDQSRSMDSIMAEAAEQQQVGGEQEVQQHLDDGLSPKQRADIKWQLMKEGIKQWFSQNWPALLAGLIAAGAVIIAAIVASGGAVLAALPMILNVLAIVFAAEAIAKITGHLRDYMTKGWAGDIQGGGKSLAKALAAGAIELALLLTFEVGKVAVKGGKAIAKGVKTVAKGAGKVATKAFRGIIKGVKYVIEKGKVLFKGIAGTGVGKQFNKLQDFGKALLERMRFRAFRIRVANRRFRLEGLINPWVLLASGEVKEVSFTSKKKTATEPEKRPEVGDIVSSDDKQGFVIGWNNKNPSKFVKDVKNMTEEDRKLLYEELAKLDKEAVKKRITGNNGAGTVKFADDATVDNVMEELIGEGTTSSFKPYYKVLEGENLIDQQQLKQAIEGMEFQGQSVDKVRHALKKKYEDALLGRMTDPGAEAMKAKYSDLPWQDKPAEAYNMARHREMLRLTENLNPSDKGNLAEVWYKKVYGSGSSTHVKITPAKMQELNPGTTDIISQDRLPDAIIGNTLREQKHIAGQLNDHDLTQFDDFMKLRGKNIPGKDGAALKINDVKYTFTNPKGVKANAEWMKQQLKTNDNLSFEIFNTKGDKKIITKADLGWLNNKSKLDEQTFSEWLGLS
jgi:Domain of unknown function (DUF4157)